MQFVIHRGFQRAEQLELRRNRRIWAAAMRIKLNGWQRIGIVLSLIWFVIFGGYVWQESAKHSGDFYKSSLLTCGEILDTKQESLRYIEKQEDRNEKEAANVAEYEKCRGDAEKLFYREVDANYASIPIYLAIDFGIVVFGWLVAWLVVAISKWIRRGFA